MVTSTRWTTGDWLRLDDYKEFDNKLGMNKVKFSFAPNREWRVGAPARTWNKVSSSASHASALTLGLVLNVGSVWTHRDGSDR